jgi:hypothetical protein
MPLVEAAKILSSTKKTETPVTPAKKYSTLAEEPKEEAGEFPGDYFERYKSWMNNLSPEDRKKRTQEERKKVTDAE